MSLVVERNCCNYANYICCHAACVAVPRDQVENMSYVFLCIAYMTKHIIGYVCVFEETHRREVTNELSC